MKRAVFLLLFACFAQTAHAGDEAPAQNRSRTINVVERQGLKIASDKGSYQDGEIMKVTVEVPTEGYLRLYGVDANGQTTLIFPNKFHKEDKVEAGTLVFPPDDARYDFKLSLDPGQTRTTESLHAVFSPEPFQDSGQISYGAAEFEALGNTTSEERSTRGLKPKARVQSTNAELKYEIAK